MIDIYFNMKKIKFDILDELINDNKISIKNNTVNVFINMEPIIKHLTTDRIDKYLRVKNESKVFQIISNILNLAAHYRLYFSTRKIHSNVYIYMQHPFDVRYKNRIYNRDFREMYRFNYADNVNNFIVCDNISASIPFIKIILEYVENVNFIEAGCLENSLIPYIINKETPNTSFIVTSDIYEFQYAGLGFNILYPKQDESRLITKDNIMAEFGAIFNVNMEGLTYKQLPFMLSIMGNIDRNIYGIKGTGKVRSANLLRSAIECGGITKDTDNIELLLQIIKKELINQMRVNYKCVDIPTQYTDCNEKDIYGITSQMINKFDNVALKELNDEYFEEYPMMLDAITSKPMEKRQVIF